MKRTLTWAALALLLACVAVIGAVLVTLASTGVLRTAPPAWVIAVPVAGQRVPVSAAGLLRLATLPGAARLLDGRRIGTRIGELRFAHAEGRLVVRCAPCALPSSQRTAVPLLVLDRAELSVVRRDDELSGELRAGGAVLHFDALIEAERISVRWTLPRTPVASVVAAMARSIPETRHARIDGSIAAQGRLVLPQMTSTLTFDLQDFEVGGLGTEVLRYGWFRLPCTDAAGRPRTLVSGDGERGWLPLDRSGPYLASAVLAAEDQRFHLHDGIDREEIAAALADLNGAPRRGASTLTQQLARTLFTGGERSAARKLRELLYATEMERTLGKPRILELYLNTVDWGPGICGARAAARSYFGKTPARLAPQEAAWLAAILRNPHVAHQRRLDAAAPERDRAQAVLLAMRDFPRAERMRWSRQSLVFATAPRPMVP